MPPPLAPDVVATIGISFGVVGVVALIIAGLYMIYKKKAGGRARMKPREVTLSGAFCGNDSPSSAYVVPSGVAPGCQATSSTSGQPTPMPSMQGQPVNATDQLAEKLTALDRLKSMGLLSEEEYAAKRTEVLGRI